MAAVVTGVGMSTTAILVLSEQNKELARVDEHATSHMGIYRNGQTSHLRR
jgi:hypothetical protein